ncbi:hypothetical protein [Amycolatopsis sp. NPDC004169]|uniref:hypothetical protein n=1 Tax=Amycolatopsis sp. NPDC004169 TaxID=3154453 RepID=UPI0033B2FC12
MPDDEEWAFEAETDLWDDGERPSPAADEPEPDGRDGDAVVTVTVAPDGEVRQVRLTEVWKSKVDPRGLHSNVLTAANAAAIETLAQRAREVQENPPPRPPSEADETPLPAQDVLRLEDAVRANWSSTPPGCLRPEPASSPRKAAAATCAASIARNTEVESELLDVLRILHRRSAPADFAPQPRGPAYTELMSLLADHASRLGKLDGH